MTSPRATVRYARTLSGMTVKCDSDNRPGDPVVTHLNTVDTIVEVYPQGITSKQEFIQPQLEES